MSLECSECESDLRSGHADGCSRRRCECGHALKDHAGMFVGCCAVDLEDGELAPCDCAAFTPKKYEDDDD